ncbi:hypothetical protein M758_12G027900 [Ceratodon purpureus]|nr:hypothetical protein M758_12G027900 [Ceratodon purpureus]
METKSEVLDTQMETKSEVSVEAQVQLTTEEGEGAVVGDNICIEDLFLPLTKEQEAVLTEGSVVAVKKNDPMAIENCAAMLHSLPAPGNGDDDGKGPAADENDTPLCALQAESSEQPCKEVALEPVDSKEQEGWNGDGDGKLAPVMDKTALPEFLAVPEDNEPAWGDVPDDIPVEPIFPPRPPKRPRVAPECVEVDDVVQTMRNILFNLSYADDAHLNPEDEAKVRDLLEYHPNAEKKRGSGIDFIKIKRHHTFKDVRCFWVVRTDGTETDFSYHKCLKGKVAKENPSFVDRYDAIYRAPKRPRMA